MILQKLTRRADPHWVVKALKQEADLLRSSFAVVRKAGTEDHYVLRGEGAHTAAPAGSLVTFKQDPSAYEAKPDLTCEVVGAGRSRHLLVSAIPTVGAMLCGSTALLVGAEMALGSGRFSQAVGMGLAVLVAGVFSVGHYVRGVARRDLGDFRAEYLKTAIDFSDYMQVDSVERHVGMHWPRAASEPARNT